MLTQDEQGALHAIRSGKTVAPAVQERLLALKLAAITPRGDVRLTGRGNEAMTYLRHGFAQSLAKLLEPEEAALGETEDADEIAESEVSDEAADVEEVVEPEPAAEEGDAAPALKPRRKHGAD